MEVRPRYRRQVVFERDKGVCACCRLDTTTITIGWARMHWNLPRKRHTLWDLDHMTPLKLGGTNDLDNLQTLCYKCHQEKTRDQDKPAIAEARRKRIRKQRRNAQKFIRRQR